jgi:hypothetical protein
VAFVFSRREVNGRGEESHFTEGSRFNVRNGVAELKQALKKSSFRRRGASGVVRISAPVGRGYAPMKHEREQCVVHQAPEQVIAVAPVSDLQPGVGHKSFQTSAGVSLNVASR